jgi:hypothetical protein
MKTTIIMLAALLVLGLVGCSSDETPTAITESPRGDAVKVDTNFHGATLVRYEDNYAVIFVDEERELQLVIGVDIAVYCTTGFFPDIVRVMEVTNPVDQDVVSQLLMGRGLQAAVFPLYPFDCARYVGEGPIASGLADVVSTDNDLYAYFETNTNPRVNSFQTKVNGTLYTPEGTKVLLNCMWKTVWPGYPDLDQIRELRSDIFLATTGGE